MRKYVIAKSVEKNIKKSCNSPLLDVDAAPLILCSSCAPTLSVSPESLSAGDTGSYASTYADEAAAAAAGGAGAEGSATGAVVVAGVAVVAAIEGDTRGTVAATADGSAAEVKFELVANRG